ncbi:MAG: HDIG domain-containing metalloprotein [Cyanobacteria bacterium P01_H01_bin.58]
MKMIWRWMKQFKDFPGLPKRQEPPLAPKSHVGNFFTRSQFRTHLKPTQFWKQFQAQTVFPHEVCLPPKAKRSRSRQGVTGRVQSVVFLSLSVVTLTAAMGQRFYRQPALQVDTVAPTTVYAPTSATVVDAETTEARRAAARSGAVPVLTNDPEKDKQIQNTLNSLLTSADALRSQAGRFPFWETNGLSASIQQYLREISESEWEALWQVFVDAAPTIQPSTSLRDNLENQLQQNQGFRDLDTRQQQIVRALIRYRQQRPQFDRDVLQEQVEMAQAAYRSSILDLSRLAEAESGFPNEPVLLQLSETEWTDIKQTLRAVLERMLLQGIVEGVPSDLLAISIAHHLDDAVPNRAKTLASDLLLKVLEPNLVEDPERTREKAEAAAEEVPDVTVTVQDGAVIIRQGETIDQPTFVLLDHFGLSQRRLNIVGLVGFGVLVTGACTIFLVAEQTVRPALRRRDQGLIVLILLSVSGLSAIGLAVHSLPAVGMLISSFYGMTPGAAVVGLLALLLPIGTRISPVPWIASTAGALVCSLIAPRLRSREELALLGGIVGVSQGAVYLALTWMMSPVSAATWYLPITGAILQGIYGIISSIVALGLSPYLEHLFDVVTPIRLAELSSPNRPMLKRLASEAPGTFQHTLFVASLAEAAARTLRCNVELVRAGTLYHDIGKMHDPLGFIENQMGGPNKHDEISDPWVSADIIKKHVSEGLVMARRCRLPKTMRSFIPEHQGTMLISYFYYQAQELAKSDPSLVVREEDFRYDGPIPQSPETGIVMLADSCEAALRSLKEASPEEALAMVNRILKARWRDNQLIDSGLTREHMEIIAQVFVQVWQQYNHKRIAYPKGSLSPIGSPS